jgi:hypothetical protein
MTRPNVVVKGLVDAELPQRGAVQGRHQGVRAPRCRR